MRELRIVAFENACPFEVNLKIKAGAEATILVDQTIRAKGKKTFDLETLATMENGVEFWLEVEAAEDTIVAYYAGASRELDRVRPAAARSVIKKSERFEYQEISNDMATVKARARRAVASLRSFRAGIQPRKTGTKVTAGILKDVFSLCSYLIPIYITPFRIQAVLIYPKSHWYARSVRKEHAVAAYV